MGESASRAEVFNAYLSELEASGVAAVVLHTYADLPGPAEHDIDLAVADLGRAVALQSEVAEAHGWRVVNRMWHEVTACYAVLASAADPSDFLKLDLCSDYMVDGRCLIPIGELLAGRGSVDQVPIPAARVEFGYLLAKALVKRKPASGVLPRLTELHGEDVEGCDRMTERFSGGENFQKLKGLASRDDDFFKSGRDEMLARQGFGPGRRLREVGRKLGRLFRPTGAMLVVLGPDGAGKSTVIDALERGLKPFFRRYRYIHFRAKFSDGKVAGGGVPTTDPQGQKPRSVPASCLKVLYYTADYAFSYWRFLRKSLACSTLIVFDRYYQDILVDGRRFRLRGADWLARLLSPLVPKPMLYLVLDADPALIHARKAELPEAEIARQRELFRQFAAREPRAQLISTGGSVEETVGSAMGEALEALAAREARR